MNEPAFPLHNHGAQTLGMHLSGMTLRDYFAAKAMQAILSSDRYAGLIGECWFVFHDQPLQANITPMPPKMMMAKVHSIRAVIIFSFMSFLSFK